MSFLFYTMIKAVIFDLDNTLLDFMRMKTMSIDAALNGMIEAGMDIQRSTARKRIFEIYEEKGWEYQEVLDDFIKEETGILDYKILAGGIVAYKKAKDLKPDYARTYNNIGTIYKEDGNYPEALSNFKLAFKYDPGYALACRNIGDVYLKNGNNLEAIDWLHKATGLDSDNLYGWYWLGRAYYRSGKVNESTGHFLRVLSRKPDLPQVHHDLGKA